MLLEEFFMSLMGYILSKVFFYNIFKLNSTNKFKYIYLKQAVG